MAIYFEAKHALEVHRKIIEKSGGKEGVINIGYLESAIDTIQHDGYCPTFEKKLTKLVFSVNKNHSFLDGNKRTSIALGAYFLEINGYDFCVKKFIREMENPSILIADDIIDKDLLEEIITSIIYDDDFHEELQIKLVDAYNELARRHPNRLLDLGR